MSPGVPRDSYRDEFAPADLGMIADRVDTEIEPRRKASLLKMSANSVVSRNSILLCGVLLTDEWELPDRESKNHVYLGTLCVDDFRMKLEDLRRLISLEVQEAPESFIFLSKEGWPLWKKQECLLKASHVICEDNVICIRKYSENQKFGIAMSNGDPLGFVFVNMNAGVKQLREQIEQLRIGPLLKMEYRFMDRNKWPVMPSQEAALTVIDIMEKHVVYVQHPKNVTDTSVDSYSNSIVSPKQTSQEETSLTPSERPEDSTAQKKPLRISKKVKEVKEEMNYGKSILISYVRAEAAQYALDLKKELVQRGLSVYLDVHEIKVENDWQDSLNNAVSNCFMFVPLITPMYGQTRWTNREIKCADYKQKVIVPVNFMDSWPPACLAIQFASKQYIPWKIQENDHMGRSKPETPTDKRVWPKVHVERVAKVIAECYKENYIPVTKRSLKMMSSLKQPRMAMSSTPVKEEAITPQSAPVFGAESVKEKHVIVICAHPKQRELSQDLKSLFENEGHLVWCSDDWQEGYETLNFDDKSSLPTTPRDLPTIAEDEVFFNQHERELPYVHWGSYRKTLGSKEYEPHGRRPLSRMLSQFSDLSQPSTLSQEQIDMLSTFQKKVDQAGVIIFLVSEDYTKSAFSQEQVFYCEHRKKVVLVKCDDSVVPAWFKLLMRNDMIVRNNNAQFECMLKSRVKRALDPASAETPKDATFEAKIKYLVNFLKCNLPLKDMPVYVTGSSKLQSKRSEEICRALGCELSKISGMSVVTGGFYGASDVTANSFFQQRESSAWYSAEDSSVVHILPMTESEDMKSKAKQNVDGSFEVISYGKTFFIGDNLKERETVVARLLDICIVIEGGPGVVREIEEFIWNDHFVIPVCSTGGAAGGKYGIPMKIFELPPGVSAESWSLLSDVDASPETVAKAVVNIILSLKSAVATPVSTLKSPTFPIHKRQIRIRKSVADSKKFPHGTMPHGSCTKGTQKKETLTVKRKRWWQRLLSSSDD